jgi:hypothetical protein
VCRYGFGRNRAVGPGVEERGMSARSGMTGVGWSVGNDADWFVEWIGIAE